MSLSMIKMGDTRNEYRILVRHFIGKIYLTERTNVRVKLHWILWGQAVRDWSRVEVQSVSCPMANFRLCGTETCGFCNNTVSA